MPFLLASTMNSATVLEGTKSEIEVKQTVVKAEKAPARAPPAGMFRFLTPLKGKNFRTESTSTAETVVSFDSEGEEDSESTISSVQEETEDDLGSTDHDASAPFDDDEEYLCLAKDDVPFQRKVQGHLRRRMDRRGSNDSADSFILSPCRRRVRSMKNFAPLDDDIFQISAEKIIQEYSSVCGSSGRASLKKRSGGKKYDSRDTMRSRFPLVIDLSS